MIDWLQSAPPSVISTLAAIIGAVVAIVVVALTQWILSRRARTELLTSKLEELYLLLNQAASENVDRFERMIRHLDRPIGDSAPPPLDRSVYSLELHKKIIMYIQLYFPHLKPVHVRMFRHNSAITDLLHAVAGGGKPEEDAIRTAFENYGDSLRNMEDEIIQNRSTLVRDTALWRRYKVSDLHVPMPEQ